MSPDATQMDAIEIGDFLAAQTTGVVALAKDDDSYAIPVSFEYVDDGPDIYLRLGFAPGSQKRDYLDATDTVSFVVYDETDEGWKSVVAQGRLEELSATNLDTSVVQAVKGLHVPYFRVFDRPVEDLEFSIYRLDITSMRGVVEAQSPRK